MRIPNWKRALFIIAMTALLLLSLAACDIKIRQEGNEIHIQIVPGEDSGFGLYDPDATLPNGSGNSNTPTPDATTPTNPVPDTTTPTKPAPEADPNHKHCTCAGNSDHFCDNSQAWTPASSVEDLQAIFSGANWKPIYIYLTNDIFVGTYMNILPNAELNICLNGHTLTMGIRNYGKLNITDCTGKGTLTSSNDWTIINCTGATTNLFAGNITISDHSSNTRVIVMDTSAYGLLDLKETPCYLNIYGGKIYNPNQTSQAGANIWMDGHANVTMHGGEIGPCNVVNNGGNDYKVGGSICIRGKYSVFTMKGGLIQGGKLNTHSEDAHGASSLLIPSILELMAFL